MAKDWFYQANDGEQGPFTGTELKQLARQGAIVAETKIRKGPEGRWVLATQVQGLVPAPGSVSPTDSISTIQVPPKDATVAQAAPAPVAKPKPVTAPKPTPIAVPEPESSPFDPFSAFSNSPEASATADEVPSADATEDPFGFSDTFSNPSAFKKKIKAAKQTQSTEGDSAAEPKAKRKGTPHKAILAGVGGLIVILIGVAGYLFIFKKGSASSGQVAKTNPPASTNKEATEPSNKENETNANADVEKISTKAEDKSPAKAVETAIAKAPVPVEVQSLKADTTPVVYTNEADLYEAVSPSVAMMRGRMSGGSGFLLEGNLVVTNKHVVESELIEKLKIHFPSAGKDVGPYDAELLYKDRDRDIAILRVVVPTKLKTFPIKPTKLVKNYKFRPGEKVMAIGSPGSIVDDNVSENALATGLLSTKAEVDHKKYYQMDMPVNSGNSGGPVFDYKGNVIGVVTLKAVKQEAHGFCIPAEEVEDSLKKQKRVKESGVAEMLSNHRVKAVYSVASESSKIYLSVMQFYILQARLAPKGTKVKDIVVPVELRTALKKINQELHEDIQKYYEEVMEDKNAVSDNLREQLKEFWENFQVLKKSAESPDGKLDAYQKQFQEAAKKFAELKPKLKEGLGVEYDH